MGPGGAGATSLGVRARERESLIVLAPLARCLPARPRTSSGSGQATSRRSVLPVERLAPRGPPESRRSVLPSSRPTRREERDPNRSRPGSAKRHARQDKSTRHTSPMLKWNLTHIEVGISFLKRNLTHIEVKLHPPWECLVETVLSYPPLLVKPGC